MSIRYWNRRRNQMETEDVYGGAMVGLLYGNLLGYKLTDSLLSRKFFSRLYGGWQNTSKSARKIASFQRRFGIDPEDWKKENYASFNDFFVRRFRPGKRSFPTEAGVMGACAEARYFAYADTSAAISAPVKGLQLDPIEILANTPDRELFRGGPCLLARLCPVDYHRFHFPDSGRATHFHEEHGKLHSVNPAALRRNPGLFLENERHISILQTENFGKLAYVEVGALCVGKIVQSRPFGRPFKRGEEKGYFLFGGSTILLFGQPGKWTPTEDLLRHTKEGFETLVELGSPVAKA
jgi:phosphatidylserine decarboxylase